MWIYTKNSNTIKELEQLFIATRFRQYPSSGTINIIEVLNVNSI